MAGVWKLLQALSWVFALFASIVTIYYFWMDRPWEARPELPVSEAPSGPQAQPQLQVQPVQGFDSVNLALIARNIPASEYGYLQAINRQDSEAVRLLRTLGITISDRALCSHLHLTARDAHHWRFAIETGLLTPEVRCEVYGSSGTGLDYWLSQKVCSLDRYSGIIHAPAFLQVVASSRGMATPGPEIREPDETACSLAGGNLEVAELMAEAGFETPAYDVRAEQWRQHAEYLRRTYAGRQSIGDIARAICMEEDRSALSERFPFLNVPRPMRSELRDVASRRVWRSLERCRGGDRVSRQGQTLYVTVASSGVTECRNLSDTEMDEYCTRGEFPNRVAGLVTYGDFLVRTRAGLYN
ncbi:hypothetical protein L2D01_11715 [Hyphomonadaceae bacterium ML37]|nr:hypothetical protein L2D01_11715 [Hyphomonadaceae bacterium ML37]